jgi:hypothetical protein
MDSEKKLILEAVNLRRPSPLRESEFLLGLNDMIKKEIAPKAVKKPAPRSPKVSSSSSIA